jgi:hypothetical protein
LCNAKLDVFRGRGGQLPAKAAAAGKQCKLDIMIQKLGQGLSCDLNVAKDQNGINLVTGHVQKKLFLF